MRYGMACRLSWESFCNSERATEATQGELESALNWIENQQQQQQQREGSKEQTQSSKESETSETNVKDTIAYSIKCSECNSLFRNTEMAEWHAHKTGHLGFEESHEEIKPLTEEEKKLKLEELRVLAQKRRSEREAQEEQEHRQREIQMREEAKKMHKVREAFKEQELKRELEEQKRKKKEDLAYKESLKAKIEADRKELASRVRTFPPLPL
jgi:UBX domain-containing protein 1/4